MSPSSVRRASLISFFLIWAAISIPGTIAIYLGYSHFTKQQVRAKRTEQEGLLIRGFEKQARYGDWVNAAGDLRNFAAAVGVTEVRFCKNESPFLASAINPHLCPPPPGLGYTLDVAGEKIDVHFVWDDLARERNQLASLILGLSLLISLFVLGIVYLSTSRFLLRRIYLLATTVASANDTTGLHEVTQQLPEFSPVTSAIQVMRYRLDENIKLVAAASVAERLASLSRQVAHDIRSPLSALRLAVSRIKELPDVSDVISIATTRIEQISDSLLRPQGDTTPASFTIDLLNVIQNLILLKSAEHGASPASFAVAAPSEPQKFNAAVSELTVYRLLSNFVNNSLEALGGQAESLQIQFRINIAIDHAVIEVQDNGPGFSSADLQRFKAGALPNPNLQKQSATGGRSGHGLGISSARQLIRDAGGDIEIENVQHSNGALVRIRLPIV